MTGICVTCSQPLLLQFESDDDDIECSDGPSSGRSKTVPDSVELTCGCYFHWECLLDAYSMNECPNCAKNVTYTSNTGAQQILCNLNNEGGLQENLDIMPLLVEAWYLKAYPEERKGRAFVEFAAEGDVVSMLDLLIGDNDDEEDEQEEATKSVDVLRYQDPLRGLNSALHAAIERRHQVVAWLLLWLASNLDSSVFPVDVVQQAQEMGISRWDISNQRDIRSLKNEEGRTAAELAANLGGDWNHWVTARWLEP